MSGKIGRWGNSAAVRIPKDVLERAGLREGQAVDVVARNGAVDIRPSPTTPRYTLAELVSEMKRQGPENRPPFEEWGILPSEWPQEDWSDIAPTDEELGLGSDRTGRGKPRRR
jgi:antitoxin MazE